jgi:hypothetical protein
LKTGASQNYASRPGRGLDPIYKIISVIHLVNLVNPVENPLTPYSASTSMAEPINDLTRRVIACAYSVHNTLGAGFLEKRRPSPEDTQRGQCPGSF